MRSTVDAYVDKNAPGSNFGSKTKLLLRGSGSDVDKRVYVHFTRPFPLGATILTATLSVYAYGAWSGSNSVTVKRISESWKESTIKWNNKPSVSGTGAYTLTAGTRTDDEEIQLDVSSILQHVADGDKFFGFELTLTQDHLRALHSGEASNHDLHPVLTVTWSDAPLQPDQLSPSGSASVSEAFPRLAWRYNDKVAGHKQQTYSQVQIATSDVGFNETTGLASPVYDSGQVANDANEWTVDGTGGYGGLVDGDDLFWSVKVWDNTGLDSPWADPVEFTMFELGSLTIDAPGATVPETTPPFTWTLTGRTQLRYTVSLFELADSGPPTLLWKNSDNTTDNSVTPPPGLINLGPTYRVQFEVWDTIERVDDGHLGDHDHPETQDFTLVLDSVPDPVDSITGFIVSGSPAVTLDFTRSVEPDYFALVVDGTDIVDDRIDPADIVVSPGVYEYVYWGATPRSEHTYEIQAVVSSGGGPFKHSSSSDALTFITKPVGIWVVDPADNTAVQVMGDSTFDASIGESATTFDPVGSRTPVRLTDAVRGYEGTISGVLLSVEDRDNYLVLKGRFADLQIIVGSLSFPFRMEDTSVIPTSTPGDFEHHISFTFYQSGKPWPTRNVA